VERVTLLGEVRVPGEILPEDRHRMFRLLDEHFEGVERVRVEADLAAKHYAILLRDASTRRLVGFSTLAVDPIYVEGELIRTLFSGDTIIHPAWQGHPDLARVWLRLVFDRIVPAGPGRVYWFLLCAGYKTYRFLPVFFKEFHPGAGASALGPLGRLAHELGKSRFPDEYDEATGVVRFRHPTPLRRGVAALDAVRLRDPHVAFFAAANPGHAAGDELACVTALTMENLTRAGHRLLGGPGPGRS